MAVIEYNTTESIRIHLVGCDDGCEDGLLVGRLRKGMSKDKTTKNVSIGRHG